MIIDDQIKSQKLQYNINREAAKISALTSDKIDKDEYLTAEEILPSNQQQIIAQAKFTYPLLGKSFEKQIKTIENQREKQIKAIQTQRNVKTIKKYDYDDEDRLLISKQKNIYLMNQSNALYQSKEITKKDTIFINSESSKTSKAHILMLKLTNELDLKIVEKIIALSNLSIY